MKNNQILIDLDNTIAQYSEHYQEMLSKNSHIEFPQSQYAFFLELEPIPNAKTYIEKIEELGFEIIFVTRPSVRNPMSYTEKRYWIEKHFGFSAAERLYIAPDKARIIGDYLIDDCVWEKFHSLVNAYFFSFKFNKVISTFMEFYNKNKNTPINSKTANIITEMLKTICPNFTI